MSKKLSVRRKDYILKDTLVTPAAECHSDLLISGDDESDGSRNRAVSTVLESLIEKKRKTSSTSLNSRSSTSTLPTLNEDVPSDEDSSSRPPDTSFYEKVVGEEDIDKTMVIALSTVANMREVPGDDTNKQLAEYVLKVFDTDEATIRKQWVKATSQEKPELKLVCDVKSGTGLMAKDANGKSDPYVRLGIIKASRQHDHIVKTKNLLDWQKEGGILPTGEVVSTSVKKTTLEPQWNEHLELSIGDTNEENLMLVVEVWDSDKTDAGPTKIKGLKGFGTFLTDLRKSDDFMGRAFLSLRGLPNSEEDKSMQLCSHSGKHKYGFVTLGLVIEGVKMNTTLEVGMWEHLMLTHAVVNSETRTNGQYKRKWCGEFSEPAKRLLDQHAEFAGLEDIHKAVIHFSIMMKYHRLFAVRMSAFTSLIRQIKSFPFDFPHVGPSASLETGSTESSAGPLWVSAFYKDLIELANDIEEILKNHLTVFNVKQHEDIDRIRHRVEALRELYSFSPFVEQLPPEKRDLKELLEKTIQVAVPNWFLLLCANLMPEFNSPEMQLSAFKGLSEHVLNHCHRLLKGVNPIFEEAGVDYFTQFYVATDKLLSIEAISRLEVVDSPDSVLTYEIYRSIKGVRKLSQFVDKKYRGDLKMLNSHKWFQRMVNSWISLATDRCKDRIKKAINLDTVVQVTDEVQFSSSAVDGTGFLLLLMKLSDELEWPSKAEAFTFMVAVVRSVCDCALFYVGEVYKSLTKDDMFDAEGRFRATEKLSIVLNNMQHIKQVLVQQLKKQAQEPTVGEELTTEEMTIQAHSREVMETIIESAGEDIDNKIAGIICQLSKQICPDMQVFIEHILASKSPTVDLESIDPLMVYMAANLQTLGNHLLTPVFFVILENLWCVSIDCLISFLKSASSRKASTHYPAQFYSKLLYILQSIREFFYADGDGLSQEDLETQNYKFVKSQLEVLRLPTDELIQRFYGDLADLQAAAEVNAESASYGRLYLSVGYHKESHEVEVNLLQAEKLPGLDNSGLSDPFVELTLMPPWLFRQTSSKKHKTAVKKKTLNPSFNEVFHLLADQQFLETDGAILLLTIFDHDIIRSNDLCGICVVPCKDIPVLAPTQSAFCNPNATERKNCVLPLFRLKKSTVSLKELHSRAHLSDSRASDFFKNNKHILAGVDPDAL